MKTNCSCEGAEISWGRGLRGSAPGVTSDLGLDQVLVLPEDGAEVNGVVGANLLQQDVQDHEDASPRAAVDKDSQPHTSTHVYTCPHVPAVHEHGPGAVRPVTPAPVDEAEQRQRRVGNPHLGPLGELVLCERALGAPPPPTALRVQQTGSGVEQLRRQRADFLRRPHLLDGAEGVGADGVVGEDAAAPGRHQVAALLAPALRGQEVVLRQTPPAR